MAELSGRVSGLAKGGRYCTHMFGQGPQVVGDGSVPPLKKAMGGQLSDAGGVGDGLEPVGTARAGEAVEELTQVSQRRAISLRYTAQGGLEIRDPARGLGEVLCPQAGKDPEELRVFVHPGDPANSRRTIWRMNGAMDGDEVTRPNVGPPSPRIPQATWRWSATTANGSPPQ